jgi:hypothetical protein
LARAYLYAVTDCPERLRLGAVGVGSPPAEVEVAPVQGVGVAFSLLSDPAFRPGVGDVRSHQAVLDLLVPEHTVLPFSFATLAEGWPAVERFVVAARDDFLAQMERLRGRIEVGLKVFWRKEAVRAELQRAGVMAGRQGEDGPEGAYNRAIRVGQAVESLVLQWRDRYVPKIEAALAPLCEASRESPPIGAAMLWNASFLVARDREPALRAAAHDLDALLGDRLDFRYVAPLPPYNFVDLRYPPEDRP